LLSGALFIALWVSGFFSRLFKIIEEMMFSNWQLALLGATAIALSLASGYTTFDGLRNFTSAPLLSILIAFGIQGVMLIVAWLIGESFATGMNQRSASGKGLTAREATVGMLLGVALAGLAFYWLLNQYSAVGFTRASGLVADWGRFADVALYFLIAVVLVAVIAFNFRRGGDISTPYVQSVRLIAKNSVQPCDRPLSIEGAGRNPGRRLRRRYQRALQGKARHQQRKHDRSAQPLASHHLASPPNCGR